VNFCVYYLKGLADYVAVWDNDEFFIPKGAVTNIVDLVEASEPPAPLSMHPEGSDRYERMNTWEGGRGWATGDGHPYCYIQMQ
jgi:hypothetical protein